MTGEAAYVLVVDDEWMNRELLQTYLTAFGYRVGVASTGEDALAMAFDERPDLIMLDLRLTGIDGFEVCRRLRADKRTAAVPVLMITAMESAEDEHEAALVGANGFVTKPYKAPVLMEQVAALLDRASS